MKSDLERLGLPPTATTDEVRSRFRELALQHHPDHGGDALAFGEIRLAYERVLAELALPQLCITCGGTGKVRKARGVSSVSMLCTTCQGAGR